MTISIFHITGWELGNDPFVDFPGEWVLLDLGYTQPLQHFRPIWLHISKKFRAASHIQSFRIKMSECGQPGVDRLQCCPGGTSRTSSWGQGLKGDMNE